MAMVIDDRSEVWENRDQPQVHAVPPFTPYYAPQAQDFSLGGGYAPLRALAVRIPSTIEFHKGALDFSINRAASSGCPSNKDLFLSF
ncbi:hypothetical protein SAY86_021071 [Trapa natans]|uniref:Uncharacterized protein n=1 Tax=Trapa natans TaxID=22666 RepID=A0AAN7RCT3_TRANT|nr:hypothetical protein SAY86_021071 [Trapa natans]